jgi:hypothetical protein
MFLLIAVFLVHCKGQLPELIEVIIEEKASLFVSAVGLPPDWAIQKVT